ncbi:MAG: flavin reductase family protein [Oceanospirillaceae bacterium]|nr:flavin reductase family protein [Oceanospirillaceae bacterium]
MYLDIDEIDALQCYQAAVAAIVPRPIAWVSTRSASGILNLAPYSFFSVASCDPLILSVTQIKPRDLKDKDTLTNLRETGECVVNIVSAEAAQIMNASCANFPAEIDEFAQLNIEQVNSVKVNVPGVAISPVRFECKLEQIICISEKAMGGSIMLLKVVAIHSSDSCTKDMRIQTKALKAIGKMGGDSYATTTDSFDLARP